MLSVSYAGKNVYSTGKTSGVLRGGASGVNRCYVLAHCGGGDLAITEPWGVLNFWIFSTNFSLANVFRKVLIF